MPVCYGYKHGAGMVLSKTPEVSEAKNPQDCLVTCSALIIAKESQSSQ